VNRVAAPLPTAYSPFSFSILRPSISLSSLLYMIMITRASCVHLPKVGGTFTFLWGLGTKQGCGKGGRNAKRDLKLRLYPLYLYLSLHDLPTEESPHDLSLSATASFTSVTTTRKEVLRIP
jgi:hypothetical protein